MLNETERPICQVSLGEYENFWLKARQVVGPDVKLLAVVKANAYGLGALRLAGFLEEMRLVNYLGVSTVEEGVELRKEGIQLPILMFSEPPQHKIAALIQANIIPAVYSESFITALNQALKGRDQSFPVHLKINTGMNRLGINVNEVSDFYNILTNCEQLTCEGVFTHLANADSPEDDMTETQLRSFKEALTLIPGSETMICHTANSAAYQNFSNSHLNMVRIGIASFHIATLKARVCQVKAVPANQTVGYSAIEETKATQTRYIATVNIGYADGVPRRFDGEVLINQKRYPVVGPVSMDWMMVDLGVDTASMGDEVVIFGRQGEAELTLEEFSKHCQRIPYESLCSLGHRVSRHYHYDLQAKPCLNEKAVENLYL